jgi:adenylosuccinate synthase
MTALLNNVRTLAIVCSQWGDTGKGKFVDYFAHEWADIIARGTGGANAGHTIEAGGKRLIVHLVPSGIMCPGKINVIGNGVVLDPRQLARELSELRAGNIDYEDRLIIAQNAKLVLPQHLVLDKMRGIVAGKGKIGTTGRGIGPAYAHYYDRFGLFVNDLLNRDVFVDRLDQNLAECKALLKGYDRPDELKKIMSKPDLGSGMFYSAKDIFDRDNIVAAYLASARELESMVTDTDAFLRESVGRKNILAEGAQGLLLSILFGTYPFVTSSDCSDQGLATGIGLRHRDIDKTLAIVKAFLMTRVGEGAFPTEMGGAKSAFWCGGEAERIAREEGFSSVEEMEVAKYSSLKWDEPNEFLLGIISRLTGKESASPSRLAGSAIATIRRARHWQYRHNPDQARCHGHVSGDKGLQRV